MSRGRDPDICPAVAGKTIGAGHDPSTPRGDRCSWCGQVVPLPTPQYELTDQDLIWHQRYRLGLTEEGE